MKKRLKRGLCAIVLLSLLCTSAAPAHAASGTDQTKSAYGIEVGLISYGVDLNRIYQGSNYDVTLFIGNKSNGGIEFKGSLGENLPNEKLWECIDKALGDEHMTRQQLIETNKMIAKMLQRINQPQESFYEELDMVAQVLGVSEPVNLLKQIAADTGSGMDGLSAMERQYVKDQLSKQSVSSFTNVKDYLAGKAADEVKEKVTDAMKKAGETISEMAFAGGGKAFGASVGVIGKVYEAVALTYKLVDYQNKNHKEIMALKQAAMAKQLQVESFYAKANKYVMEYLDNYPKWQLRIDESGTKQYTDLSFVRQNGSEFYNIPGMEITWSAYALLDKVQTSAEPNGEYRGILRISASYNTVPITDQLDRLTDAFQKAEGGYANVSGGNYVVNSRSAPVLKQEWVSENCAITISGLSQKSGTIILDLPSAMEQKISFSLDYEKENFNTHDISRQAMNVLYEACTPENATVPVANIPAEQYPVWYNWIGMYIPGVWSQPTEKLVLEWGYNGKPFFLDKPFGIWTDNDKGIEISPKK